MFRVRRMKQEDFPFAVELANTMNWNMTQEDFAFNANLEPQGCFTLMHDLEPIGVATCISYGSIGWFGNLLVNPTYRRKGAGTLLVKHATNYLRSIGTEAIGLYAYMHLTGFYQKLGFKRNADFAVLKAQTVSAKPEGKLRPFEKQDLAALVEFDSRCFGASRRKLLKPILLNTKNLCYVSANGCEINGYVATKTYETMTEVGPLVCSRKNPEVAVSLLKTALSQLHSQETWMLVPTSETALISTAEKAGFREDFRVPRMFLGSAAADNCVQIAESLERG